MQASSSKEDAVAKTDTSLWFGWSSFRPRVLQCLNGPKWFLFFLCQYFFTQSVVVNGVFAASISTIEKRFGYSRYVREERAVAAATNNMHFI